MGASPTVCGHRLAQDFPSTAALNLKGKGGSKNPEARMIAFQFRVVWQLTVRSSRESGKPGVVGVNVGSASRPPNSERYRLLLGQLQSRRGMFIKGTISNFTQPLENPRHSHAPRHSRPPSFPRKREPRDHRPTIRANFLTLQSSCASSHLPSKQNMCTIISTWPTVPHVTGAKTK